MNLLAESLEEELLVAPAVRTRRTAGSAAGASPLLATWLRNQSTNVTRHAAALRPFKSDEFGTIAASPTEGHIQAVNALITSLRKNLLRKTSRVGEAVTHAIRRPVTAALQRALTRKEQAHNWVRRIERIWDFYFELFGQRQSRYADWLMSCDRIALDCYQDSYLGLAVARPVPAPPPFSYMRTGFSPATFRRGIPLRRLGRELNPFPLIQLPYHRLINPWTLGAMLHEVSHNLQNDLGLAKSVPRSIAATLQGAGLDRSVTAIFVRWHRETFADMMGLLLGGPSIVGSLLDVIGRGPATVLTYDPGGPHPTPYIRAFLSFELLGRMGFPEEARSYRRMWSRIFPNPRAGTFPPALIAKLDESVGRVVDAICFRPFESLGGKCLSQVVRFAPKEQAMVEEAARRLAAGTDPGILPERFYIGAARVAIDRRLARPGVITKNFYKQLARG